MTTIKQYWRHFRVDLQLIYTVLERYVFSTKLVWLQMGLFVLIVFILQWLFNVQTLRFILTGDSNLSVVERFDILLDAFFNVFRYADALVPIAIITIALLQSLAISLLVPLNKFGKQKSKLSSSQYSSLVLGVLGSGCVACGGSILTPLLSILATNVSVTLAQSVGNVLLLLAVVLSYRALSKISFQLAHVQAKTKN